MKYVYLILIAVALTTVFAADAWAGRGSVALKRISRAVTLLAVDVSKAGTEDESVRSAGTARRRLGVYLAGLPGFQADVQTAPGYCSILVASDDYVVWGEASAGSLINAGVDYSGN